MPDIGATFGYLGQGQAALDLTGAARGFDRAPGLLSGLRLIDTVAGVVGVDRISGQLAKYAVKLALKGDQASLHAAQEMVELMRSRVPQDSGLLLNGITYRREGGFYVVEAKADRGGYDYALAVEAGHHAGGQHADADFFADTTGRGGRQVRPSQGSDVPGQPYFYGSAREALSDWSSELGASIGAAAREEGL
ncbi:phage protein, HK97 gp10 family [Methylobacterium sp. ME121]|nr:phage protein, HK97 gp10 family [Methylobacterium sp. ME121]